MGYDNYLLCIVCHVISYYVIASGLVPLHNACSYGHYEVTELLVKHGASVNVADLWKFTPLHEAAAKGKYEIVKLLLKVLLSDAVTFGRIEHYEFVARCRSQ